MYLDNFQLQLETSQLSEALSEGASGLYYLLHTTHLSPSLSLVPLQLYSILHRN